MNREIKFKFWDGLEKEFINMDKTDPIDFDKAKQFGLIDIEYSGVNDCQEKEIYEGYILICVDDEGHEYTGFVIFDKGCFCFKITKRLKRNSRYEYSYDVDQTPALYNFTQRNIRIIGNIFQNSNLLNNPLR